MPETGAGRLHIVPCLTVSCKNARRKTVEKVLFWPVRAVFGDGVFCYCVWPGGQYL
jgi:hypothetical protein